MLTLFVCHDSENSGQLRQQLLHQHLAWVKDNMSAIKVAGPQLDNNKLTGSLYIIEADSQQQAKTILSGDPYYQVDVWQRIDITEFKAYAGDWVGGENWPTITI